MRHSKQNGTTRRIIDKPITLTKALKEIDSLRSESEILKKRYATTGSYAGYGSFLCFCTDDDKKVINLMRHKKHKWNVGTPEVNWNKHISTRQVKEIMTKFFK